MRDAELTGLFVLLALILAMAAIVVRRWLATRAGAIDVCWRAAGSRSTRWTLGQGRFNEHGLALYRSFSPVPLPARILFRDDLDINQRRSAVGAEVDVLPLGSVIVACTDAGRKLELAVSEEALTGLRAWVEGLPPGGMGVGGDRGRLGGA